MTGIVDTAALVRMAKDYAKRALLAEGLDEGDSEEALVRIMSDAMLEIEVHRAAGRFEGLSEEAAFAMLRYWLDIRIDCELWVEEAYEF